MCDFRLSENRPTYSSREFSGQLCRKGRVKIFLIVNNIKSSPIPSVGNIAGVVQQFQALARMNTGLLYKAVFMSMYKVVDKIQYSWDN